VFDKRRWIPAFAGMTFYELFGHKTAMPSTAPAKARAKPVPISLRIGITFF
jgi:hypothetical protein